MVDLKGFQCVNVNNVEILWIFLVAKGEIFRDFCSPRLKEQTDLTLQFLSKEKSSFTK